MKLIIKIEDVNTEKLQQIIDFFRHLGIKSLIKKEV